MDGLRVLVADDDPAMGALLQDQLTAWGCVALSAESLETALRLLAVESFQVVLSDLHMPHGDGFQLLAAIRLRWPQTSVILMSAFPSPETEKQALEAGARALLAKPFSMEELQSALMQNASQR